MKKIFCLIVLLSITFSISKAEKISDMLDNARKADQSKSFAKAIDIYNRILKKDSKNKEAIFFRGLDYLFISDFDNSIKDFDQYILLDSTNADAFNNRGLAKSYTDSILMSFNDFNKAIEIDSNMAQAYINRAMTFISVNNYIAARMDLEKAKKLQPKNPSLYLQLANVEYRDKNYDKALDYYDKTIKYGIKESETYYKRGNTQYRLNNYDSAILDYTKAIKLDSMNFEAFGNRAMAYQGINKIDLADKDRDYLAKVNKKLIKETDDGIDINKLHYVFYPDSSFGMEIPEKFNILYSKDSIANTYFFTLEQLKSPNDFYTIGGYIEMIRPTDSIFGVSEPFALIDIWKDMSTKYFENFNRVQPITSKTKPWGAKWQSIYSKTIITRTVKEPNILYYNYGLASDNVLINIHFEIPENMRWKYETMFEKAFNTITVR